MNTLTGQVTLSEPGALDADVLLLDGAAEVVSAGRLTQGAFSIDLPSGFAGGQLLVRMYKPVVGAQVVPVDAQPNHPLEVQVDTRLAHTLAGRITLPPEAPPGWVDVHLTPRALDGVPVEATRALLAVGTAPERRGTYISERIQGLTFALRVMPGDYRLEVDRLFVDSAAARNPPISVQLDAATVDGAPLVRAPVGVWLAVRQDVTADVQMAVVQPEDL